MEDFYSMNLDQRLLKAIADLGWSKPTDIQQAVIPLIFERKSIVVQAKTGSGKTAAFAIPIVQDVLLSKQNQRAQTSVCLVLAPTKELCNQAFRNFKSLCKYSAKCISCVDVSQHADVELLRPILADNPDIVIGTPTRVLAHLRAGQLSLNTLRYLIVDEADLVFTFGYNNEIQDLKNFLPAHTFQVILLSATLTDSTKVLRRGLVKGGDWVRVELPEEIFLPSESQLTQYLISAEEDDKYTILIALIKLKLIRGKTIIFTNSVDRCFKLRLFLEEFGVRSVLLNSELPVLSRCHAIDQFNRGVYDYLLATDEMQPTETKAVPSHSKRLRHQDTEYGVSRGIDFQLVSNVINFDFPTSPSFYVHRVGRTARANQLGTALSLVNTKEQRVLEEVEALLNPSSTSETSRAERSSVFRPYQFRLSEVDGFRYRAMDVVRRITRKLIREARLKEIKIELMNSERLKGYFEDHVPDIEALRHDKPLKHVSQPHLKDIPDYLVPAPLKALLPTSTKSRTHWRQRNLHLGSEKKKSARGAHSKTQFKHKRVKKKRNQNPLFSFGQRK